MLRAGLEEFSCRKKLPLLLLCLDLFRPSSSDMCTSEASTCAQQSTAMGTIKYLLGLRVKGISLRSSSRSHPHGNRTNCSIGVGGDPRAPRGQRADGLKIEVYPLSFEAQACRSCEFVRRSTFSTPK